MKNAYSSFERTDSKNTEDDIKNETELTPEELGEMGRKFLQLETERAPEVARMHAENLIDTENAFSKRLTSLEEKGDRLTREEFEKWEDDFSFDWQRMYAELSKVGVIENMSLTESSIIEADAQYNLMMTEQKLLILPKGEREEKSLTVEANAGHFHNERSIALIRAIDAAGGPSADSEKATVHGLFRHAREHLAYKYPVHDPKKMDPATYRIYNNDRTGAHNAMIKSLNEINDLARKYGTKPLTPRNFWPSDRPQPTGAISARMRADRDIVEAYVNIAFSGEVERAQRDQERAERAANEWF